MSRVKMETTRVYPVDYMFQEVEKLSNLLENEVIKTNEKVDATEVALTERLNNTDALMAQNVNQIRKPQLVFTFDDGYKNDISVTAAILKANGMVGCFGLIKNKIFSADRANISDYMGLEKEGFEVLSHSYSHLNWKEGIITELPDDYTVQFEYGRSADEFRKLGFQCRNLIVPYNGIHPTLLPKIKRYYDFILVSGNPLNDNTCVSTRTITRGSLKDIGVATAKSLIDDAIAQNKMLVFYDHEVDTTSSLSAAEFTQVVAYAKTKVDEGSIEVNNLSTAIQRFFGYSLSNYETGQYGDNIATRLSSISHTGTGTPSVLDSTDPNGYKTVKLTLPASPTGTVSTFGFTVTNPELFRNTESMLYKLKLMGNNSQYGNFTFDIKIDLCLSDGTVKQTITNPNNTWGYNGFIKEFETPIYFNSGITILDIKLIKVNLIFNYVGTPSVAHQLHVYESLLIRGTKYVMAKFNEQTTPIIYETNLIKYPNNVADSWGETLVDATNGGLSGTPLTITVTGLTSITNVQLTPRQNTTNASWGQPKLISISGNTFTFVINATSGTYYVQYRVLGTY